MEWTTWQRGGRITTLYPIAVFSEEWGDPKTGLLDRGRPEAPNSLTRKILNAASHVLALPSPTSKWTRIVIEMASDMDIRDGCPRSRLMVVLAPGFEPGSPDRKPSMMGHYTTRAVLLRDVSTT